MSPKILAAEVIRSGRRRFKPASTRASRFDRPSSRRRWLTASIKTIALLTTMPASITAPIKATTLTVLDVKASAATTPIAASGRVKMMTKGCRNDSNCEAITR